MNEPVADVEEKEDGKIHHYELCRFLKESFEKIDLDPAYTVKAVRTVYNQCIVTPTRLLRNLKSKNLLDTNEMAAYINPVLAYIATGENKYSLNNVLNSLDFVERLYYKEDDSSDTRIIVPDDADCKGDVSLAKMVLDLGIRNTIIVLTLIVRTIGRDKD